YGPVSGTSASAAFVSGVAALVRSKYPDDFATVVKRRIIESADMREQLVPFVINGGRLNASAALAIEINITPPVLETAKYKKGSGKLFVTGQGIQSGAVLMVGNSSFALKPKGGKLLARVPQSAFTVGIPIEIRLRNPDGGLSQARTITL
ncbi:MAG TPA: S8 family serine peptidase, partial [Blastocatellia bacterium]|nr:S8 family serine peptidase [Blastocatellia bacterium]